MGVIAGSNLTKMELKPYLIFQGNAEAAMNFYIACFQAEIVGINRYDNAPMEIPENYTNKILHAEIKIGSQSMLFCDILPDRPFVQGSNFSMSVDIPQVMEMDKVFNQLAVNGKVEMPLQDTFWGARFGILIDQFGIRWMLNCDLN